MIAPSEGTVNPPTNAHPETTKQATPSRRASTSQLLPILKAIDLLAEYGRRRMIQREQTEQSRER